MKIKEFIRPKLENFLFYLKNSCFADDFSLIYGELMLFKHKDDLHFWNNMFFHSRVWTNMNYSFDELIFTLFFTQQVHKKVIYDKYGYELLHSDLKSQSICSRLCLYLYHFGLFMDNDELNDAYDQVNVSLTKTKFSSSINRRLFNLINDNLLHDLSFNNKLTKEEVNKMCAKCLIYKMVER